MPLLLAQVPASFGLVNWLVLGGYLAGMVAIGVWCSRREGGTEDFFLAGRRIPWWAAGLSIFGTQLSAITFMAIPATAYGDDWVRMTLNLMIATVLPIVALCYLPFFRRTGVATAYEYLERRFARPVRLVASGLFVMFQIGRMGIVLYLPSIALAAVTGLDVVVCIVLMGVLATIYTVMGGIEAVIWTDVVQVIVLVGGVLISVVVIVAKSGGVGEVMQIARDAGKFEIVEDTTRPPEDKGLPSPPTADPAAPPKEDTRAEVPPWLGRNSLWLMIVGGFFLALAPYSSDQTVVQRYMTTPDERAAARSLWLNFWMTVPTAVIFFGFGTALYVFYAGNPGIDRPEKADWIVPWFVVTQLPPGVAGLVIAGIFAAAMSSLDSSMNSVATAIVNDFASRSPASQGHGTEELGTETPNDEANSPRCRASTDDAARLRLARILTVVLGVIGTGAALVLASIDIKYLLDFYMGIVGLFGGALAGLFALAVFTTRVSTYGAFAGLVGGTLVTAYLRFATQVNGFLHGAIGFAVCVAIGLAESARGRPDRDLTGLTIWTIRDEE